MKTFVVWEGSFFFSFLFFFFFLNRKIRSEGSLSLSFSISSSLCLTLCSKLENYFIQFGTFSIFQHLFLWVLLPICYLNIFILCHTFLCNGHRCIRFIAHIVSVLNMSFTQFCLVTMLYSFSIYLYHVLIVVTTPVMWTSAMYFFS